jgi:hypothetical protein
VNGKNLILLARAFAVGACNRDVDNAQIEGVILDTATGLPISKASLQVENAYYHGGDYDGYGGYDSLKTVTDSAGAFHFKFHKSAYIQVKAYKSGYQIGFLEKDIVSNQSKFVLSLKKQ